ncbi:MAG: extracellular solute-binding protein, partial [Rhodospirillaceae bacterium]
MKHTIYAAAIALAGAGSLSPASAIVRGKPVHGIALYGEPKYGSDFKNFDYVNPNAPKGGTLTMSNANDQTFDTFNPFTLKGAAARGAGLMFDTLMVASDDEPFTHYCFVCETVEVAEDNSWEQFKVRAEAKFSDGSPITAEDVAYSFNTLIEKGGPAYRFYYADVAKVEVRDPRTVRFTFKVKDNRELPLIMGQLPILSKAYWSKRDFTATSLDVPVSSGPYTVDSFEVGRRVIYKRATNYWAINLPHVRGQYNFDRIRFEFFRDQTASFEAFKAGTYDVYPENIARQWATGYDFPAAKDGRVIKLEVPDETPMTAQGFVFNLRRPMFQDRRVREAMNLAFDFESLNKTIFYNQYVRLRSYWQKSDLEAKGPPSAAERALLEPLKDKLPPGVLTDEFKQPTTDGSGNPRANLVKARDLLLAAGWTLKDGVLAKDGKPLAFELLEIQKGMETMI